MEELELTQEEQEYNKEYEEAFFGTKESEETEAVEEVQEDAEELQAVDSTEEETEDAPTEEGRDDQEAEDVSDVPNDNPDNSDGSDDNIDSVPDAEVQDDEVTEEDLETIVWKGKEVKVTKEEMTALAQKGFDYTSKTQEVAKLKKEIEYIEKFDKDDLEALEKFKAGDKEALAYLLQKNKVDAVDMLDVEPNLDLHNEEPELLISDSVAPLVAEVESNPEVFASMQDAVSKLPQAVTNAMQQDAVWFNDVYTQVTSGNFEKVIPQIQVRLAQMDNVQRTYYETNPQAYATLYTEVLSGGATPSEPEVVETPKATVKEVEKPNMAEVGVKRNGGKDRRAEVKQDAFTSDSAYQATLARMRRWA